MVYCEKDEITKAMNSVYQRIDGTHLSVYSTNYDALDAHFHLHTCLLRYNQAKNSEIRNVRL
jgi:hypothetical protein